MAAGQIQGRNVLIAMDGSKPAINAFEWYVENVHKEIDNVILAYCVELAASLPPLAQLRNRSTIQAIIKSNADEVDNVIKAIDDLANKYTMKHTVVQLQHAPAGEAIVKAAKEHNVAFIIAGSRGLGSIRRTILGSVSDYILHHSHVPVFICKLAERK